MKYKNIHSAIHNLGDSFLSELNYVDDGYILDDLREIHKNGHDMTLDWLTLQFSPPELETARIKKSIGIWSKSIHRHFEKQNVDLSKIESLRFVWPAGSRKYMRATDDRGKDYKIYVHEIK
jgi:hypothetical protein